MKYLKQSITEFTYTNIPSDYATWSPTNTYVLESDDSLTNASVVLYENYYYRSVTNDNIGFNPIEYLNIKWVKWGISNEFAMIDLNSLTKSIVNDGPIVVEFLRENIETLGIGNFESTEIKIEHLDTLGNVIHTDTKYYSINEDVFDYYSYVYSKYTYAVDRGIVINLVPVGHKLRVSLSPAQGRSACGFLIGGQTVDMGATSEDVNFSFNSFTQKDLDTFGTLTITKRNIQDLVDFETYIDKTAVVNMKREIKSIYDEIILFILDPDDASIYENMQTLGTVENASVVTSNGDKAVISWSIFEAI